MIAEIQTERGREQETNFKIVISSSAYRRSSSTSSLSSSKSNKDLKRAASKPRQVEAMVSKEQIGGS